MIFVTDKTDMNWSDDDENNIIMKDVGLLILRLGVSLSMLPHGWSKLMKLFDGNFSFTDPIGVGEAPSLFLTVFAEFFCSIALIIGYKAKWAAIPLAFTMFVATAVVHFGDPWGRKEIAFIYLIVYITIAMLGPGKYSIDRK